MPSNVVALYRELLRGGRSFPVGEVVIESLLLQCDVS